VDTPGRGGTVARCTLAPSTPEAVTVLLDPYSIPTPQPRHRPGRSRPPEPVAHDPALLSVSHTVRRIGSRSHRAHILYTHSAWHIRPVAAPGFGPRRTADNTARTIRHIAACCSAVSLGSSHPMRHAAREQRAYTSGAFPSPATAPHAFVLWSCRDSLWRLPPIRFGKVVAEPCSHRRVPTPPRGPTLAPLASQIFTIEAQPWGSGREQGPGRWPVWGPCSSHWFFICNSRSVMNLRL
jgi:hypothetical protein